MAKKNKHRRQETLYSSCIADNRRTKNWPFGTEYWANKSPVIDICNDFAFIWNAMHHHHRHHHRPNGVAHIRHWKLIIFHETVNNVAMSDADKMTGSEGVRQNDKKGQTYRLWNIDRIAKKRAWWMLEMVAMPLCWSFRVQCCFFSLENDRFVMYVSWISIYAANE